MVPILIVLLKLIEAKFEF